MATLADLEAAIEDLLSHPLGPSQYEVSGHIEGKTYEAYVFGLCLRVARELGATPVLRGIVASPIPFIFRGAPGQIHSTSRNYGYAEFSLGGETFEIHSSVEFVGTSGMMHELDVCVMRGLDAQRCRQEFEDPLPASLIGGWECKFYGGKVDKGLGRAFVGLLDDLGTAIRITGMCSNSDHEQLRRYLRPRRRPFPHFHLTPLYPSNENVFVNQLKGELKKMAGV